MGLIGVVIDSRYRIDEFIAQGGFGYVYRGTHLRWDRPIAIKVFKPTLFSAEGPDFKAAFIKEGAILNDLSRRTTAIVQSYDIGEWQSTHGVTVLYTVLEWVDGRPLSAIAYDSRRDGVQWPLGQVIELLRPVAHALSITHGANIAHRDVTPKNILVGDERGEKTVKLLDFGVAKVANSRGFQTTAGGLSAFTVGYAAPEQLTKAFGPTGPWTDVYALALICVELLSGRQPFAGRDVLEMSRALSAEERPTPRSLGATVTDAVEAVFRRALAVESAKRYPEAGSFWAALESAARGPG
jgi:serine/threonine-protein kinase